MATVSTVVRKPLMKSAAGQKTVEQRAKQARRSAALLKQLSDPTRLQIVLILARGERHVGSLCEELGITQAAVSHHLALMRHGGIIMGRRQGKNNFYSLTDLGEMLAGVASRLVA